MTGPTTAFKTSGNEAHAGDNRRVVMAVAVAAAMLAGVVTFLLLK